MMESGALPGAVPALAAMCHTSDNPLHRDRTGHGASMTTYRVLLPHPLEARLLMLHAHGEWRLPEWEDGTERAWQETDHVNRAVAARFGFETTVLRCIATSALSDAGAALRIYELDNHSAPHDTVPASTWVGAGELGMIRMSDPETAELVVDWFRREAGELPLRGAPWTRRGWFVEALAWTVGQMRARGAVSTGPPEQLRAWERAFLLRLPTEEGSFYFKAAPDVLSHEPPMLEWFSAAFPLSFPEVVAVDRERGWLLQREAANEALPLIEVREEEEWYRAVRRLAEIQLDCSTRAHELRAFGCPHRGLEVLARRIPRLCADAEAMLPNRPGGLTPGEIERVANLGPTLLALCEELASCQIPDSVEHGDVGAASVLSTIDGPVYLDWSDSSISHPFFSVVPLATEAAKLLPASSRELRKRLRDSYLTPWSLLAPYPVLVRAFEIARVLAPVHFAATIHAELLPAAGYRWEIEPAIPEYMRTALRLVTDDSPLTTSI
jgi:hypothetical protein